MAEDEIIKLNLVCLLLALCCSLSFATCPFTLPNGKCFKGVVAENPSIGKEWWVNFNAGGSNNAGGGGLKGAKCESLIPYCDECSPGFKTCVACKDYSAEGGFATVLRDGVCVVPINFDDFADTQSLVIFPIPNGYGGLDWDNMGAIHERLPGTFNIIASKPRGASNAFGTTASFSAPTGATFTLVGMQLSHWQPLGNNALQYAVHAFDEANNLIATSLINLPAEQTPVYINFDSSFESVFKVSIFSTGANFFEWFMIDDLLIK